MQPPTLVDSLCNAVATADLDRCHRCLLVAGADPNQPLSDAQRESSPLQATGLPGGGKWTATHMAAWLADSRPSLDILQLLLEHGAEYQQSDTVLGQTPLHLAAGPEAVLLLLDAGADPGATDIERRTPLHTAASPAVAIQLLANGADPAHTDQAGMTAAQQQAAAGIDGVGRRAAEPAAMRRLHHLGVAKLVDDWVLARSLLPRMQALQWAKINNARSGRLAPMLCARVGRLLIGMCTGGNDDSAAASSAAAAAAVGPLPRWVWSRFCGWLQWRTELQRAREAARLAAALRVCWLDAEREAAAGGGGGGVEADGSALPLLRCAAACFRLISLC
jgi:hypothetical protein